MFTEANNLLRAGIPTYRAGYFSTYFRNIIGVTSLQSRFLLTHGTRFAQTSLGFSLKAACPIHHASRVRPTTNYTFVSGTHTCTWILLPCQAERRNTKASEWSSECAAGTLGNLRLIWSGRRRAYFLPTVCTSLWMRRPTVVVVVGLVFSCGRSAACGFAAKHSSDSLSRPAFCSIIHAPLPHYANFFLFCPNIACELAVVITWMRLYASRARFFWQL